MRPLGVGVIGFGFIGKVHSHAHRSIPLLYSPVPVDTELVGVTTRSEETGKAAVKQAGFKHWFSSAEELIACPDISIIHICTPNSEHASALKLALSAGKHIYCDKPLALNLNEAQEISELASLSQGVHQMTFNYRFVPALMRARELTASGFLGDLFQFRIAYLHAGYIDPKRPYSWRTNFALSGGGAVADLGAHIIDLTRYLVGPGTGVTCGGEFTEVDAELQTIIQERPDASTGAMRAVDVDDIAHLRCRLAGGARGTIEASRLATGVQDELRVELHGSKGSLKFNLMEPNWLDAYDATIPEGPMGAGRGYTRIECTTRYPKPYSLGATKNSVGWLNFHIHSLFDFLSNVAESEKTGKTILSPSSPGFEDGAAAQRVIDAALRSAKLSSRVSLL
jgi:predicted dehydrogenase